MEEQRKDKKKEQLNSGTKKGTKTAKRRQQSNEVALRAFNSYDLTSFSLGMGGMAGCFNGISVVSSHSVTCRSHPQTPRASADSQCRSPKKKKRKKKKSWRKKMERKWQIQKWKEGDLEEEEAVFTHTHNPKESNDEKNRETTKQRTIVSVSVSVSPLAHKRQQ